MIIFLLLNAFMLLESDMRKVLPNLISEGFSSRPSYYIYSTLLINIKFPVELISVNVVDSE